MASAASALIPQIANYNPTGFAQQNQMGEQQIGLNALQAQRLQQETALQKQQTQGAALQNQLVQQQINDQKALGQAWAKWDQQADPDGRTIGPAAIKLGATPQSVMAVEQHRVQVLSGLATADKTTLENNKARADDFAGKIQAIIEADPKDQDNLIAQYKSALLADDPRAQIPDHFGLNEFKGLQKLHLYLSAQTDQALKAQQTKEAAAGTEQKQAEAGKAAAEKVKLDLINERLKQGAHVVQPGEAHPIDGIFPASLDPAQNQYFKSAYDTGAQFVNPSTGISEVQQDVIKRATDAASKIREAQNPQIQAGKAEAAKQEEIATAPTKRENAVAIQRALNSTAALGNVPPHLIPQYQGEVAKVANAYGDAANAANEMQEMIDMMRLGNKVAYAYSPTTGVLTINSANGVKRVNMAEIGQYAGAGSLLDQAIGFFGKKLTGEGVPSNIVDAMEQVHSTLGENSRNSAVGKIQSLNKLYGATTDPEAILVKPTKATAPPMRNAAATAPKGIPAVGTVSKGYRFKGGDPSKPESWEKQ